MPNPVATYDAIIGQLLKKKREDAGFGQADMAQRLGLTQSYWSKIELGKGNPTLSLLRNVSKVLGIKTSALIAEAEYAYETARLRGVEVLESDEIKENDWAPLLGAAAIATLVALALKNK